MVATSNKPRLLLVTPRFPFPLIGGDRVRIIQLAMALSQDYEVDLISLGRCDRAALAEARSRFRSVELIKHSLLDSVFGMISAWVRGLPLQVGFFYSRRMRRKIAAVSGHYDLILCHLIRSSEYVRGLDGIVKILEMTDAISLNYARIGLQGTKGIKAKLLSSDAAKTGRYERQVIRDFDVVTLISPVDRDYVVAESGCKNVLVIPSGVDCSRFPYKKRRGSRIVFIGNIASVQNFDACIFFAESVLPLVRIRHPQIVFFVVGAIPSHFAARLEKYPGVKLSGRIDSVPEAIGDSFVGVCPMRIGAGVQTKVLEYMALGLPVVTTSLGLEGISAVPGRDLKVADTPEQMASDVVIFFEEEATAMQFAESARRLVNDTYQVEKGIEPLRIAAKKLLRRRFDVATVSEQGVATPVPQS